jgi:phage terminase small subunit
MPRLNASARALIKQIEADYQLELHQKRLLQLAAEAWQRTREARAAIERDGVVVQSSRGIILPHPGIKIEREAVKAFADLIKQLDLDEDIDPLVKFKRPR